MGSIFRKEFGNSGSQKSKKLQRSQDWPDLESEPIFLDFGTIEMVGKAARTKLKTSRGPEPPQKIDFQIAPYLRFEGEPGEQLTMFFYDPSGNALEFKSFKNAEQLFAV